MFARLAAGLKRLPDEVRRMRFRDARRILDYWRDAPPESEMLAFLAQCYTTWEPASRREMTEQEVIAEHRASLERRWKSGQALNPKQLLEAMGGKIAAPGAFQASPLQYTGIGEWPPKPAAG